MMDELRLTVHDTIARFTFIPSLKIKTLKMDTVAEKISTPFGNLETECRDYRPVFEISGPTGPTRPDPEEFSAQVGPARPGPEPNGRDFKHCYRL